MTDGMTIEQYRALVAQVFDESDSGDSQRTFDNMGVEHAKVVLEEMFRRAKRSIQIYSGKLFRGAFEAEWFRDFAGRTQTGTVTVLLDEQDAFRDSESSLFGADDLRLNYPGRVIFKHVPQQYRSRHLAIVDNKLARVETDADHYKALVVVGATTLTRVASVRFAALELVSMSL